MNVDCVIVEGDQSVKRGNGVTGNGLEKNRTWAGKKTISKIYLERGGDV